MTDTHTDTRPRSAEAERLGFEEAPRTLNELIRLRAAAEASHPYLTFLADGRDDARELSFAGLEERALAVAGLLTGRGLRPGDRVLIMLPSGVEFVEVFCGVLLAGMTAVPVYPPARLARLEHYLRTLAAISETASCRAVILDERLTAVVSKQVAGKGQAVITDREVRAAREPGLAYPVQPGNPAFLQFTSGTTSQPRGVLLLHEHLIAQLASYTEALQLGPGEVVCSWLPLYHDLGLIGKVLACLYGHSHLVLLSPIDFLKDPMCWLRAITRYRAIHAAAPNFAFGLCARKCTPDAMQAEGIDLSSLENMGMGGEPVTWSTVQAFRDHMAPFGFRPDALNPCYGLAENTLVATGHRRGDPLRTVTISAGELRRNLVSAPQDPGDATTLVGNGGPFPGVSVGVFSEQGQRLDPDHIGEVCVQGPSLAAGYFGDEDATARTFVERDGERWLRTGDLGFLSDGDLYVCGRQKDLMIVRGRNYHPQDLEEVAGQVDGVRVGNVAVFSVERREGAGGTEPASQEVGLEQAVVVAELDPSRRRPEDELRAELLEALSAAFGLAISDVVLVPKGTVAKTSSGKLQRSLMKQAYERGELGAFLPPGRLREAGLKLRLGLSALGRRLRPGVGGRLATTASQVSQLDPRINEAVQRVRPGLNLALTPDLRLDGLGLDSLERVELWLAVEQAFAASVPEEAWSESQTLGEVQELLERHEGTRTETETGEAPDGVLIEQLLAATHDQGPPRTFRPPLTAPLMFGFVRSVSRSCWDSHVTGHEQLPQDGFILAGNHETYLDGAWVRNALPPAVQERLVAYSWSNAPLFVRAFLAQIDTIGIEPRGSFKTSIESGLAALAREQAVLIFPEGLRTHSGSMTTFKRGVGLLSVLSQKPVVPFRLVNGFTIFPRDRALPRFWWRREPGERLWVRFGEPLQPPARIPGQTWDQAKQLVADLRQAIQDLEQSP
jgi:acyl-CoA synthetase (AMP-forming)/AMP-acid ligase II/1-acyl-sn-glycerol-3-phosphate acyltransferase/acyl carrier protein